MSATPNEERLAAIAFVLDRVGQLGTTNSNRVFAAELVEGLAEGRHIDCARAGEYDDLEGQVGRIMNAHKPVAPVVRRPRLTLVR